MTRKQLKNLIDRCYQAIDQACDSAPRQAGQDLQACFMAAAQGERKHRAVGRSWAADAGGQYALGVDYSAKYFACKWVLGEQPKITSLADVSGFRDDARLGYQVAALLVLGNVTVHVSEADRAALLGLEYPRFGVGS